jgi:hypothetical protein
MLKIKEDEPTTEEWNRVRGGNWLNKKEPRGEKEKVSSLR